MTNIKEEQPNGITNPAQEGMAILEPVEEKPIFAPLGLRGKIGILANMLSETIPFAPDQSDNTRISQIKKAAISRFGKTIVNVGKYKKPALLVCEVGTEEETIARYRAAREKEKLADKPAIVRSTLVPTLPTRDNPPRTPLGSSNRPQGLREVVLKINKPDPVSHPLLKDGKFAGKQISGDEARILQVLLTNPGSIYRPDIAQKLSMSSDRTRDTIRSLAHRFPQDVELSSTGAIRLVR